MEVLAGALWRITDDVVFAVWFGMRLASGPSGPLPDGRDCRSAGTGSRDCRGAGTGSWLPGEAGRWLRRCAGVLLMAFCFWMTSFRANVFSSFGWRFLGMFIYLLLRREGRWKRTLYEACLFSLAFYGFTIVFVTPVLSGIRRGEIMLIPNHDFLNRLVVQGFMWLVCLCLIGIIRFGVDYSRIRGRWGFRAGMCIGIIILELYMKYILNEFSHKETLIMEMTIFALIIIGLVMAMIVFVEQHFVNEDQEQQRRQMELLESWQYETMKERMEADLDIRYMYHDLKNHLLSIGAMAGDDERIKSYLDSMKLRLEGAETLVRTGNSMLDGILSEKMKLARHNRIEMKVFLDFSGVSFIRDMDICTIFGNALDNAIEAVMKVEEPEHRYIQIKNGVFANNLVIRISNYCSGPVELKNGFPRSTKKDPRHHGLGLLSVEKTVAEYQGTVTVEVEETQFVLKVMIPMAEANRVM